MLRGIDHVIRPATRRTDCAAAVHPSLRGANVASSDDKPCRVLTVSLYLSEADATDRLTDMLRRGGWPKANRSLVIREALLRLDEELAGKPADEVVRSFADRHAKRAGSTETVHETRAAAYEREPPESEAADSRPPSAKDRGDR